MSVEKIAWRDMEFSDRDAYIEAVRGKGTPRKTTPDYWKAKEEGYDPRPHRYIEWDRALRIIDFGTEPARDAMARFKKLRFDVEGAIPGKFASYIIFNTAMQLAPLYRASLKHVKFVDGWDSSYHDASFNGLCLLYGYGDAPERAEGHLEEALPSIKMIDTAIERFKRRRLVREGD